MTSQRLGLGGWFHLKVVDPFLLILRRGAEPKQLSLSAALGISLGIFPICGVTVLLCGLAAALLGSIIHTPTLMLANFIATPIELSRTFGIVCLVTSTCALPCSLVVPFLRLGEVITGGAHFPLTSDALWKVITGQASNDVLVGVFHVLLGWLVAAPFIFGVLYIFFLPCFNFFVHKFSAHPPSPKKAQYTHPDIKLKFRNV